MSTFPYTTLMIQGCTSDAGKSTVVAALCRLLARQGVRVAPFKPQNMALNSAVTIDGGEIGRAQALQAQAAGLPPHSDFNPVLLKPSSDTGAQVIIQGQVWQQLSAQDYHAYKPVAMQAVLQSYARLKAQYEVILVEGAGSPAEINLRQGDIANMGFAEAVDCPVVLVADIDRGGVFAHLVGTLACLSASEQARVVGFIINRFRGDIRLLEDGLTWLETQTGKPVLAVLPYLHGLHLDAEDALTPSSIRPEGLRVIAPIFPRLSNHTDMDNLRAHPQVNFQWVHHQETPPPADLIILGGSKNTRADLAWLRAQGWEKIVARHLRYGGKVLGICGGWQMLGHRITDPFGIEGPSGTTQGLGYFAMDTTLATEKQLRMVQGRCAFAPAARVEGYEIHAGLSEGLALQHPAFYLSQAPGEIERPEGAISTDGQLLGTYVHGLFDHPAACDALLTWAGATSANQQAPSRHQQREESLNRLAACVGAHWRPAAAAFPHWSS